MQIKIKISRISYSDIAVAALPYARQNTAQWGNSIASVIAALTGHPQEEIRRQLDTLTAEQVRELVDAVPPETIQMALSNIVTDHSDKIVNMINALSASENLGITVSSVSLSADLTAKLEVSRIDYPVVVEKFLPGLKKSLLSAGGVPSLLRPMIEKASVPQICALLDRLPGDKDSLLATLINQNQQRLISKVQEIVEGAGVQLTAESLEVRS